MPTLRTDRRDSRYHETRHCFDLQPHTSLYTKMAGYMPPAYIPTEPKWRHWPTYIYDRNYACGINYYQPMIDYIDWKEREKAISPVTSSRYIRRPEFLPNLPWTDGRIFWEERPVEPYSRRELIKHAIDAEDQAREHLNHFKIANRSDFSLAKTAEASHVTREVFPRSLQGARRYPLPLLVESARVRGERERIAREVMADIDMQSLKDVQMLSEVQDALEHGKSLRGKSARAIEFHLRTEALKNLTKSQELADIRKYQRESAHLLWDDRNHVKLMEERTRNLIDEEKLAAPLNSLSRELRGYEQKSSNYFLDKRYQKRKGPGCMYLIPR